MVCICEQILDQYASTAGIYHSRRSKDSVERSDNPLHMYSPDQTSPQSVQELYSETLPTIRSKLRQEGLKQVGFIAPLRSLNMAHAMSTEELFYLNRYKRMKLDNNRRRLAGANLHHQGHDPLNPVAYVDASLDAFSPRQWSGDLPPPVQDDLLQRAIEGLETNFFVSPNIVRRQRQVQQQPVRYTFIALVPEQLNIGYAQDLMRLNLRIIVSHPASGKVLSCINRRITIPKNQPKTVVSGELSVLASTNLSGSFRIVAQVLIDEDQTMMDEYDDGGDYGGAEDDDMDNKKILRTHHPIYVQVIRD